MAKKEESSKKQDHAKEEKIHGPKHEEPKIHAEKTRGAGKESAQGSGMWNADEKELGKVKGPGMGDFDEKGMGARGRGMGNLNQPGMGDATQPGIGNAGNTGLGNTEETGAGNVGGIDIGNYDPLASGNLGKKVAGKGCLPSILGIITLLALIMIF